jgi:ubiquinone/menaquinone biosynthesis C-methylase UbiE
MPLPRFDHLAGIYQRFRPEYPPALLEGLRDWVLGTEPADVGAGTCISTRLLRAALGPGPRLIGLEPSAQMRAEAVAHTPPALAIEFCEGHAERLPLGHRSVRAVVAAQAAHWFERPRFYAECARVLEPGGVLALLYNNRHWEGHPLLEAYERYLEAHSPGYTRGYRAFRFDLELAEAGFDVPAPLRVEWPRRMSRDEFVGMSLSSTKTDAVVQRFGREVVERDLLALLDAHGGGAFVEIPYVSEAILGLQRGERRAVARER